MKIAHISTMDFILRYLLLDQMLYLKKIGYSVSGISGISTPRRYVPIIEAAGIRHLPVSIKRDVSPLSDLVSLERLYRVMKRERFTLVHTHNPKPSLLGQMAARMAGVPVVVNTIHGFYFHEHMEPRRRKFFITMEKIAAHYSDVIISQNPEDIATAIREGICPPEKIKFLGNGINLTLFDRQRFSPEFLIKKRQTLGLPPDVPVVGFAARLVKEKGLLEFLQSARLVLEKYPKTRFLIIGKTDIEKSDALKPEVAKDYGIWEACHFVGEREDMPELFPLMDIFALPSYREGFPRVGMEASASSVPAVLTNVRGCREVVQHNRNGLLVPVREIKPLAEAIIELLDNPERAKRMGKEGRCIAIERFDERIVFERVQAEYIRLFQEKGLPIPKSGY